MAKIFCITVLSILGFLLPSFVFCERGEPWQMLFQDSATPIMEGIINLHHDLMFFLILILVFVMWVLGRTLWFFYYKRNPIPSSVVHGTFLEIVWTITPSLVLMMVALPSFALLYSMDELIDPSVTLKVIGRQWYWTYEYSDYNHLGDDKLIFDSYMVTEDDLSDFDNRLLEVDKRVVLPVNTHIRVIVTATDVIHSWAVPSLGVKIDAMPGRLNQTALFIKRPGVFYGQCSELCGVNHGFMPIVVEAVSMERYTEWVLEQLKLTIKTTSDMSLTSGTVEQACHMTFANKDKSAVSGEALKTLLSTDKQLSQAMDAYRVESDIK
uniref:Cytochrome c oxidase subunit 2 n=1 Tax=Gloeochaete wittrockiana TaxID=38269 RepID=A0A096Y6R2_9EUKA|nr:cytochrome c oxidase subunit 2 [Gloeochaete wittrockiana]AIM52018.1 cytochrome c oxidase subunit 2 [Gloeochaete wittrockiana]